MKVVLTADQIQRRGLDLAGFDRRRQSSISRRRKVKCFKAFYGSHPIVQAQIWEDLQKNEAGPIATKMKEIMNLDSFLMCFYFLRCYPTLKQLSGMFGMSEKSVQKWIWFYAKKIQALKAKKVIIINCALYFYEFIGDSMLLTTAIICSILPCVYLDCVAGKMGLR
jgi:hypothetical protein